MEKDRIESLVNRAQSGDLQAIEKLLEVAHTSVSYQCRKMMPRQEDAEDLTQEVLLTVYQKIDTLKEAKAFWSWLNRITATHCMNALSRNHVDLQFAEDEDGHSVVDDLEVLDEHAIPDKALDNAETARMIDEIISGLPEAQRMSTLLYYYNEMSVKEIAQIMNVPENTVKSRLNLARKAIKDKVLDYEKQGVKLYSVSILPFLWYFLRTAAESQANTGAAAACASGVVTTATVATTTAATTGATVTGAVTTGIAAKIVAGCLALAVAVGGAALYFGGQDPADTTQQTPTTSEAGTVSPETSESTTSKPSLNEQAMEAYDALLRQGYTDNSLQIYYYTCIDLDHDDVNELIVANNDGAEDSWTECEVYTYDDSGLKFYTKLSVRYANLYYVNNTYLLTANKSIYYYSPSHSIEVVSYHWNEDETRNDPAISVDGGEWEYITSEEYKYYSSNDGGFVESKEIIKFVENPYSALDIGITEAEILQIFYSAKDFYDVQVYGKRFLDSTYYSASDFDWVEGVIEYNGGLYAPCDEYTYDEFVQKLQSLFSLDAVNRLISKVGLLENNGKCYTYIREGIGDPILGDYKVSAQIKGNVIFEIQISFTALDGSPVTEYIYCQNEDDKWVINGFNFYGE